MIFRKDVFQKSQSSSPTAHLQQQLFLTSMFDGQELTQVFFSFFFFFFSNPFPHPSPKIRSFQNTNLVEAMSSRKQMNGLKQGEWKHWLDCQAQRWWLMIQHVTGSYGWHSEKADRACYLHQQLREWDRMHIQQGCGWLQIRGGR